MSKDHPQPLIVSHKISGLKKTEHTLRDSEAVTNQEVSVKRHSPVIIKSKDDQ